MGGAFRRGGGLFAGGGGALVPTFMFIWDIFKFCK